MFKWIRSRWLVAAAAVVVVAFIVGLAFGLSGADRTIAQEGSTDLPPPPPHMVATPDGPVPNMDLTKYPIIAEKEPYTAPVERMGAEIGRGQFHQARNGQLPLPPVHRQVLQPAG